MQIRAIEPEDMPMLANWFASRPWPKPPVDGLLPPTGALAVSEGRPIACAFLYQTGTALSEMAWLCTNPEVDIALAAIGMQLVVEHMKQASAHSGGTLVQVISDSEKLTGKLRKLGFKQKEVTLLTWRARPKKS